MHGLPIFGGRHSARRLEPEYAPGRDAHQSQGLRPPHGCSQYLRDCCRVGVRGDDLFDHSPSQIEGAIATKFSENTAVEVIWTTIPFLIPLIIAIPATKTLLALEDTRAADMSIQVTGYQWKWKYDYLDLAGVRGRLAHQGRSMSVAASSPCRHGVSLRLTQRSCCRAMAP